MASLSTGRRALVAAGLSGAIFAATSPPFDFTPGIFLGLALFAWSLSATRRPFLAGFLFGLSANLVALRFVPEVVTRFTPLPWIAAALALILLSAAQALPWAIGAWLAAKIPRCPGFMRFGVAIYIGCWLPAIFPWTPAGGLAQWPVLLQIADVVGERGVSFVVAVACALAVERPWRKKVSIAIGIVVGLTLFGVMRGVQIQARRAAAPRVKIALVQPSFDASDRWDEARATMMIERLTQLTKSAESRGAELTVWPESAYPFTLAHGTRRSPLGPRAVMQGGVHGPILTGAYLAGAPGAGGYNSAMLVAPDASIATPYDKNHLLWFGETVPLAEQLPFIKKAFARGTGLEPGHGQVLLSSGPIHAAVLNCYEDTLPIAGREAMTVSPNLLVNITNDAWFAGSAEGELHLRLSVLRAIETRRDLVRAVNRGPTSFVDATGRVLARYSDPLPASLAVEAVLLEDGPTLYARFGEWPLALMLALSIAVQSRRGQKKTGATSEEARPES